MIDPALRAIYYIFLLGHDAAFALGNDVDAFIKVSACTATIIGRKNNVKVISGYDYILDFDNYKYEYLKELVKRL